MKTIKSRVEEKAMRKLITKNTWSEFEDLRYLKIRARIVRII